jgi:hypothetical protein
MSFSKALKADTKANPAGPIHHYGLREPTGRHGVHDNAMPSNSIDTRITVNQGRTLENKKKELFHKQESLSDKANRAASRKGTHVSHPTPRSRAIQGPARNAIGLTRLDSDIGANRGLRRTPLRLQAQTARRMASMREKRQHDTGDRITGPGRPRHRRPVRTKQQRERGPRASRPSGIPGPASAPSINGTGMGRDASRVAQIGGAASSNGGLINGSSVRP